MKKRYERWKMIGCTDIRYFDNRFHNIDDPEINGRSISATFDETNQIYDIKWMDEFQIFKKHYWDIKKRNKVIARIGKNRIIASEF